MLISRDPSGVFLEVSEVLQAGAGFPLSETSCEP